MITLGRLVSIRALAKRAEAREIHAPRDAPAQDEQRHPFVQDERPDGGQRHPAGDAAAEHAR